jgi:anti-sigma regulatory factor (Ser/Thr protein kinase)
MSPRREEAPGSGDLGSGELGDRGEGTLQLDLPAAHAAARMARHLIRPFARSGGITGRELDNLLLVASELLANVVDHGGEAAAERDDPPRMKLLLGVGHGAWRLEVTDEGGGDVQALRDLIQPAGLPDLEDERGRGLFLISQMVDEISVEPNPAGRGVSLRVRRGPSA